MLQTTSFRMFLAVATFALVACGESAYPSGAQVQVPGPDAPRTDLCTGTRTGTYDEDVVVPAGATCTLRGAIVRANVKALEGARLFVFDSFVTGNVQGDEAAIVHVTGGTVEGNIQISGGTSADDVGALVDGTIVARGNIQIEKMRTDEIAVVAADIRNGNLQVVDNVVGTGLDLIGNDVAGNLQVFGNAGAGEKVVRDNRVRQALQCQENEAPFTGGPNAAGEAEEQCF